MGTNIVIFRLSTNFLLDFNKKAFRRKHNTDAQEGVSSFASRFLIGLTAEKLNKIINKIKIKNVFCLIFIQIFA